MADVLDQLVPRCHERVGALLLEARGERVDVDPGLGEAGDDLLGVAAVGRQEVADDAVVAEGEQGLLGPRGSASA